MLMRYEDACLLLAAVVERARADAKGGNGLVEAGKICKATTHDHRAMVCASEFLDGIDKAISFDRRPSTSDVIQAYLEVIE